MRVLAQARKHEGARHLEVLFSEAERRSIRARVRRRDGPFCRSGIRATFLRRQDPLHHVPCLLHSPPLVHLPALRMPEDEAHEGGIVRGERQALQEVLVNRHEVELIRGVLDTGQLHC